MIQNQEFIQEFVDEAKSHIDKVEAALLKKDKICSDKDLINEVFRAVHSIKGTAGFFGLKKIVALSHAMENVFGEIRGERLSLDEKKVDILLFSNDCLKEMIEDVFSSEEADISSFLTSLNTILENEPQVNETVRREEKLNLTDGHAHSFSLKGSNIELLKDGIAHGHIVYELKFRMNHDLLTYQNGPIKLFNKIQSVGMLVDTFADYSQINTFEDIIDAVDNGNKDVYLSILVTTVLEKELFSNAIDISVENINILKIEAIEQESAEVDTVKENKEEVSLQEGVSLQENAINIRPIEEKKEKINLPVVEEKDKTPKKPEFDDSIRVHVSILNDLLNMASEMVLGRNQLLRTLESYRKTIPGLAPILQNIDRLTSGMQEKIMQTRMQPVANIFNRFPRIIRDISKSLSKDIELLIEGVEVELDKSMIEALTDPLTHLVRNAADHGLEAPEVREKTGKTKTGFITLRAYHEGGYVNIDITDDGAGIDVEKIKKKAIEKELISREELEKMSEQDALKLIFKPGFSTADKITDVSGRGVGMDVVKTNIEKLGGSIEVHTAKGTGTTIRLILPLTLAIIQSLIVEVAGQKFALPQANLQEIVRIKKGDETRKIEMIHDSEVLRLRGGLLPIVHLADVLQIQSAGEHEGQTLDNEGKNGKTDNGSQDGKITRVLVLKFGSRRFGIAVDSIVGNEETLVKPLPVFLKDCICYSGVTIMGDGKTAMILDMEGIIRTSNLKFRTNNDLLEEEKDILHDVTELQNLLLFKGAGSETFALDLSMVSRIEEIKAADIERVGDKEYIKFRGDSLQVIRPEDYLNVSKQLRNKEKLYVIIPKLVSHPIGILFEEIYDNITTRIALNTENIREKGLVGSTIYDNRIVLIINIYELFEKADPIHYVSGNPVKGGGLIDESA